jgi:hypothetical protein
MLLNSSSSRTLVRVTCLGAGGAIPSREELRADYHMLKVRVLLLRGITRTGGIKNSAAIGVGKQSKQLQLYRA